MTKTRDLNWLLRELRKTPRIWMLYGPRKAIRTKGKLKACPISFLASPPRKGNEVQDAAMGLKLSEDLTNDVVRATDARDLSILAPLRQRLLRACGLKER